MVSYSYTWTRLQNKRVIFKVVWLLQCMRLMHWNDGITFLLSVVKKLGKLYILAFWTWPEVIKSVVKKIALFWVSKELRSCYNKEVVILVNCYQVLICIKKEFQNRGCSLRQIFLLSLIYLHNFEFWWSQSFFTFQWQ